MHTDGKAVESARLADAVAFKTGQDVVFESGSYAPETLRGRRLLAHELVHTVQQYATALRTGRQARVEAPSPVVHRMRGPVLQRQERSTQLLRVAGDTRRVSPPGGVAISNGALTWELRYVGSQGQAVGDSITRGTDVEMRATFVPGAASDCPTLTFLQTVRPMTGSIPDTAHLLFTRAASSGSSVDVLSQETEPFYGAEPVRGGAGMQAEPGATVAGQGSGQGATFFDNPVLALHSIPPGQTATREFELAVICVETGRTLGSITWGYSKTHGGTIALIGAGSQDVRAAAASSGLEEVRQAFYGGFFQYSLRGFGRGSANLTTAQLVTLQTVAGFSDARRIVLVGANDNSGGPEANANLSLQRAQAARRYLVGRGVPQSIIEVQGHGVEARVPNPPGRQVAENRRVDIHIERGEASGVGGEVGSPNEALRYLRQDPRLTFSDLVQLLMDLQITRAPITDAQWTQLTHMLDGLRRWRRLDPSVPDVDAIYGPTIRALGSRRTSSMLRPSFPREPEPLLPPDFRRRILESTREEPF